MSDVHHERVFFSGRVQGVGFRYSTLQVAKEFDVAGFVQNLADGRVQVEVEGMQNEVAGFLQTVEARLHGFIRKTERQSGKRSALFEGFAIR